MNGIHESPPANIYELFFGWCHDEMRFVAYCGALHRNGTMPEESIEACSGLAVLLNIATCCAGVGKGVLDLATFRVVCRQSFFIAVDGVKAPAHTSHDAEFYDNLFATSARPVQTLSRMAIA